MHIVGLPQSASSPNFEIERACHNLHAPPTLKLREHVCFDQYIDPTLPHLGYKLTIQIKALIILSSLNDIVRVVDVLN